ncbi:MAG: hypothetical protein KF887_08775 [Paracoccaceae bacterium]|nr:MAG: hypothetical protein KF887_08775 [Paracoccaceae bacterium]
MTGIGHNRGPSMDGGQSWRRHCWGAARAALVPHLPIEVLRGRLRRAAELGLDYRTYAGIRATTGHDVVAVLFSSNALMALAGRALPSDRVGKVAAVAGAARIGLATRPISPPVLLALAGAALDAAYPAPAALAAFSEARARLRDALGTVPPDRAILIAAHGLEADWAAAGRLAAAVPADRFFAAL